MMTELSQFDDYASTTTHLAEIFRSLKNGKEFHHPLLDRLKLDNTKGPALIFDIDLIGQRMQWLNKLSAQMAITPLLAVKSCPEFQYLEMANKYLCGYDVSNAREYGCLPDNLEGKLVSITSPDLCDDISDFVARGNSAVITLDSQTQLNQYFGQKVPIPYMLRIQGPELLNNIDSSDPAHRPESRFGFTIEEIQQLLKTPALCKNPPHGFHVHHGSERNRASTYRAIIRGLKILIEQQHLEPKFINLGGGWHNMDREGIIKVLGEARQAFPAPCAILLEPGRWYAENTGFAVGTIVNQTLAADTVKYTVNLSRECHLRWSKVKLIFPVYASAKKVRKVQFFGPSCYEDDRIGSFLLPYHDDFLTESGFTPGQRVVFSGVSTYSVALNRSFNGIPKADVSWCSETK